MDKISVLIKSRLFIVKIWINWLNFWLRFFQKILFSRKIKEPKNILIYKIGNIGDIVCAIPSFIAIRHFYSEAKITLLTSPGKKGSPGAKELLNGVWYLDKMKIYYSNEINSWNKKSKFIKDLRVDKYDLFIQIPDDLANFRTLLRNMIFVKIIGAKSAFGFKIRTVQLFKKFQVDYSLQKTEVESLLELLIENSVESEKIEYSFNISDKQKERINNLLKDKKWGERELIVVLNPGGKREANRWPAENFGKIGKYLQEKYDAKIIIIGGKDDIIAAEIIKSFLNRDNLLILTDKLELLEIIELFKRVNFLISNDTGAVHMAAAAGLPVIGLYCIRNVFGRWFPYGNQHRILYHKFLNCDYKKEECIKESVEMISVEEVKKACDELIKEKYGL